MRWEYKTIRIKETSFWGAFDLEKIQSQLDSLGRQGWELISSQKTSTNGLGLDILLILKKSI